MPGLFQFLSSGYLSCRMTEKEQTRNSILCPRVTLCPGAAEEAFPKMKARVVMVCGPNYMALSICDKWCPCKRLASLLLQRVPSL